MLSIRILGVEDAELFVEVRRLSLRTDPESFSARPETDEGSKLESARKRFATASPENGFVVGAFESNLAGIVGVIRASASSARIWGFYVRTETRGRGIGRALVEHALGVARQMPGVTRVELGVSRASRAARHVYIAAGFQETSFDAETSTHYMALELALEVDHD
jgi:ribosomal protein S18 acetylase RimI-like enzyme